VRWLRSLLRSDGRPVRLAAVLLLAACQPQRLLLLDPALSDPVVLQSTARPWHDAGYTVEYRRFYPHLTRQDLERYRTVILLGGREPEAPSDALSVGDVAILNEWLGRGGVVVLGYAGDGEGYLDRWIANRWLESLGAGLAIGDWVLEDTATRRPRAQPWADAQRVGDEPLGSAFDPFPLDRSHVVRTRDPSAVLASGSRHAFVRTPTGPVERSRAGTVAAVRVGEGLVVVISRHALGALGPQYRATTMPPLQQDARERTRDFLTGLARWTRRPAEWAHVPAAAGGVALTLTQAPAPFEWQPPRLAPPEGATLTLLPAEPGPRPAPPPPAERPAGSPDWLRQQGLRALWSPLLVSREGRILPRSTAAVDSLVSFLDVGGLNLLAGDADPWASDTVRARWDERELVRRAWNEAVTRLRPTSVAWVPAFDPEDARVPLADSSRGARGQGIPTWCALDSLLWKHVLAPAYGALARLAAEQRALVIALALDQWRGPRVPTPRPDYTMGQEFCDAAWQPTMARLGRPGSFDSLPVAERYRALREAGLLAPYYQALEDQVAERAAGLRDRVLKQRRDVYFAFRFSHAPADWFALGLLRGFALPDRPLLLFTPELRTRELLALYRARGITAVHATELPAAILGTRDWAGLRQAVFVENDGFWLDAGPQASGAQPPADSLARLVRRLAR
jgi:hypothetical protein